MRDYSYVIILFVLVFGFVTWSFLATCARLCLRHFKHGNYSLGILLGLGTVAIPVPITIIIIVILDHLGFAHSRIVGRTLIVLLSCIFGPVTWWFLAAYGWRRLPDSKRADHRPGIRILLGLAAVVIAMIIFDIVGFALFWQS